VLQTPNHIPLSNPQGAQLPPDLTKKMNNILVIVFASHRI
jgi:hypothetical protein